MVSLKRVKINFIVACKYSHRSSPLTAGDVSGKPPTQQWGQRETAAVFTAILSWLVLRYCCNCLTKHRLSLISNPRWLWQLITIIIEQFHGYLTRLCKTKEPKIVLKFLSSKKKMHLTTLFYIHLLFYTMYMNIKQK